MEKISVQINATSKVNLMLSQKAILLLLAVYAGLVMLWLMTPDQRAIGLPSLIIAAIALSALSVLRRREGVFPLFELGTMTILATTAYVLIPLLGFLLSGLTWTILSDSRLLILDVSPAQMGHFAWWNVGYLLSFAVVYLYKRGRSSAQGVGLNEERPLTSLSLVVMTLGVLSYFTLLNVVTGADFWHNYEDLEKSSAAIRNLPHIVGQISGHLFGIYILLKLGLVILLVQHWQQKKWRYVLFLFLGVETFITLIRMGARTELILLLLAAVLAYHRLVKPIRISTVMLLGVVMISGAVAYGFLRNLLTAKVMVPVIMDKSLFSIQNEFQASYATAADLYMLKVKGLLREIPIAIYFADFLALFPQQFLPLDKVDPAEWYLKQIGLEGRGVGFTFGVMAQAVIGGGWPELVLRGAILGYLFAAIHRWYVRHAGNFWVTFFYLWMCLFSYYTYRVSSFYLLSKITYQVITVMLLIIIGRLLLSTGYKASMVDSG
jgi:hypothetical protein